MMKIGFDDKPFEQAFTTAAVPCRGRVRGSRRICTMAADPLGGRAKSLPVAVDRSADIGAVLRVRSVVSRSLVRHGPYLLLRGGAAGARLGRGQAAALAHHGRVL